MADKPYKVMVWCSCTGGLVKVRTTLDEHGRRTGDWEIRVTDQPPPRPGERARHPDGEWIVDRRTDHLSMRCLGRKGRSCCRWHSIRADRLLGALDNLLRSTRGRGHDLTEVDGQLLPGKVWGDSSRRSRSPIPLSRAIRSAETLRR